MVPGLNLKCAHDKAGNFPGGLTLSPDISTSDYSDGSSKSQLSSVPLCQEEGTLHVQEGTLPVSASSLYSLWPPRKD